MNIIKKLQADVSESDPIIEPQIVWHYTALPHLDRILNQGILRVSHIEVKLKDKKPSIFFSKDQFWDPTASKIGFLNDWIWNSEGGETHEEYYRRIMQLQFSETNIGHGRVGLTWSSRLFCSWAKYRRLSEIPDHHLDRMEKRGISMGCTPSDWVCLFHNVSAEQFRSVQEFDGEKWVDCVLEEI